MGEIVARLIGLRLLSRKLVSHTESVRFFDNNSRCQFEIATPIPYTWALSPGLHSVVAIVGPWARAHGLGRAGFFSRPAL